MDEAVTEFMSKRYGSLSVVSIGSPPDPLITWESLPGVLMHISAVDVLNRWHVLAPSQYGGSWSSGSYTESLADSSDSSDINLPELFFQSSFTKDVLHGFANILESDIHFWCTIIVKLYKARGDTTNKLLVLNDILARHANMIRSFADQGELSFAHVKETTDLVDQVSDSLDALEHSEVLLREDVGEIYVNQAGFGEFFQHSTTFTSAFGTASAIFKYLSDHNVVYPMVKLLVSGTLFAFGTHIGDPQVFTSENIAAATKTVYGYFRSGTVGAIVQVFSAIRRLLSAWINSDNGTSLTEHLKCTNKAEHYFQLGMELLKTQNLYSTETVVVQRAYLLKIEDFLNYCRDHLGAGINVKDPWKLGHIIITDPHRLFWYKTTWRALDAFYCIENGRNIREQPCVFLFASGSSIGKTTLQGMLNQMILTQHLKVPVSQVNTFTYVWPADDAKFANGAKNSMLSVLMDDIGALRSDLTKSTGGDPLIKKLLALLNMFPYSPDMADLELKGKIFMAPKVVICSTNCPKLGLNCVYNEPGAVQRRIGDIIHVTVAPEFATPHQTLDEKALNRWCLDNPGGIPQAWTMRIEKLEADNRNYNAQGSGINIVRTWIPPRNEAPMDTHTFLRWANAKFAAHMAIQTSILETINVPYKFHTLFGANEDQEVDDWHDAPEQLGPDEHSREELPELIQDDDGDPVDRQSGSDSYIMSKLAFMKMNATPPVTTNMDSCNTAGFSLWLVFVSMWFSFLALIRITGILRYLRQRLADRYANSPSVRVITMATRGYRLVNGYTDRKRKALEWLDTNKRTLAMVTTLVGMGAVATYVIRKRKNPKYSGQVGRDEMSGRGDFVVRTSPVDSASRWSQLGGSMIDKASMYGLTQQSSSASSTNVVSLTSEHYVHVTFDSEVSSYGCLAIMVGGKEMILNRHSLPQYCKRRSADSHWKSYTMTVHGVGYNNHGSGNSDLTVSHEHIVGHYIPNRDLAGIVLPQGCRPFRDIKLFFLNAPLALWTKDFSYTKTLMPPGTSLSFGEKIQSGVAIKPCGFVVPSVAARPEVMTSPQSPVRAIKPNDNVDDIKMPALCFQLDTKEVITVPGQCGSPYFLYERGNNIAAIGGMHLGQLTDNQWSKVVIPIYRGDFDILFPGSPQLETPALSSANEVEAGTEEQSGTISQKTHTCAYTLQQGDASFKVNLHKSPFLSTDTHWAENTIEHMHKTMGVTVNPRSFSVLGYNNGGGNLKSAFTESPLSDAISNIDSKGLPDVTSTRKKVNNLTRKLRDDHARQAIVGMMCHDDYSKDLGAEFQEAAESYFESIVTFDKIGDGCVFKYVHPVSIDVAINGSSFDNNGVTTSHKAMEPINMKTSPGHPYNVTFPSNVEEGTKRVGKWPWFKCSYDGNGRANYTMGPELEASYTELHALLQRDHDTRVMFGAVNKDEPKDEAKATRVILVGPLCMTIVCRQYLLTICRIMQLNPFVFGAVVGLDATCVQWDQIRNFICGPDDAKKYTFDGDYKNYDKSLYQEVTDAVKWIITNICKTSGSFDEQQLFVIESILRCLLSPVVDVFGVVYWFRSLNTSGNSLTTQINCIANMLFIWVVWTRRMKADMGAEYDIRLSRELFNRLVTVVTYGDDHLIGISRPNMLNCRLMQQELKGLNITYTDARKSLDTSEFTPHEDLAFLGRAMVRDQSGSILCPLEFKRIMKTFHFYRMQAGVQFEHMIADLYRGLLLEIHFHGREVYETFYPRLVTAMAEHYNISETVIETLYFVDTKGVRLTYDYFRDWWMQKKDHGFIDDPKYKASIAPWTDDDEALYQRYCECKSRNAAGK